LFSSNARADTLKGFYFVPHFNLFTYAKWSPTSGDELKTWSPRSLSGLGGWILGSDMSKSYQLFSNYNGSSVGYKYKKIFIEAGVAHSYEKIAGVEIIEKQTIGYTRSRTISNYVVNYLQIPFRMGINFPDKNSSYKLTFISAGLNFDFVFAETKDYGHERYYYPNGQAIPYSQEKLLGRNKFRFNKISPFVYLGREKYSKTGRVSFKYGIMLVFKSFFQKHNTGEYLKNYKISPLIFGWAYHF
jgi:hypothetical protein